jgi:hypothetical protein
MAEAVNTCPFCGKFFKQLGQHLYRCPERHGRDYHQFLKTSTVGNVCPGCHKFFKRLDLHLKNDKSCHLILADKSSSIYQPQQPQHSGLVDNAQPIPSSSTVDKSLQSDDMQFLPKPRLKLPPKNDIKSWSEADAFMKSIVTPAILALTSVDDMNSTLNTHIYNFFSRKHGLLPPKKTTPNHRSHLQSSLSKARREKNQMKKTYRKAIKTNSMSKEALAEMSRSFHDLVHRHNKLRKEALKQNRLKDAKFAIKQCTRNFWSFTEKLLSADEIKHVTPSFSKEHAYAYFRTAYKSSATKDFEQPHWMPNIPAPSTPFYHGLITVDELTFSLKKCRNGSSPNPLDAISYTILKRCPSTSSTPA